MVERTMGWTLRVVITRAQAWAIATLSVWPTVHPTVTHCTHSCPLLDTLILSCMAMGTTCMQRLQELQASTQYSIATRMQGGLAITHRQNSVTKLRYGYSRFQLHSNIHAITRFTEIARVQVSVYCVFFWRIHSQRYMSVEPATIQLIYGGGLSIKG